MLYAAAAVAAAGCFCVAGPCTCVVTLILRITGGLFWGKYARLTFSTAAPVPLSSARHWIYRALGLRTIEFCGSITGSQSLQVLSGRAEFPERVAKFTFPPWLRHVRRPQRATVPESCTGDS